MNPKGTNMNALTLKMQRRAEAIKHETQRTLAARKMAATGPEQAEYVRKLMAKARPSVVVREWVNPIAGKAWVAETLKMRQQMAECSFGSEAARDAWFKGNWDVEKQ
jgi:hypothetical protein